MKQTITFPDFCNQFKNLRPNNFSYGGLLALYDYLEDLDPKYDLDVIELCGTYAEYNLEELRDTYSHVEDAEDMQEAIHILNGYTTVIVVDANTIIVQEF